MNSQRSNLLRHIQSNFGCNQRRWLSVVEMGRPVLPGRPRESRSGLQKQVISLYRQLLRTCRAKDTATQNDTNPFLYSLKDSSTSTYAIRKKFRTQAVEVRKRDIDRLVS
jgi:hypothetical protein